MISMFFVLPGCGGSGGGDDDGDGNGGAYTLTITTDPQDLTALKAGETVTITATVTDSGGAAASGQAVTFTLFQDKSGATLTTSGVGSTNANGVAEAYYTAGSNNAGSDVQDIVQVSIPDSTKSVTITREAGAVQQEEASSLDLAASPGNTSVLTARVVNGDNQPVTGLAVTFEFLANNGGSSLNPLTGTTDGSGNAVSVYTAGTTASSETRYDTVRASVTGASGVVIITRAPNPGPENKVLTLAQNPATSPDNRVVYSDSSTVLITATVTRNGLAWPQEPITFSIVSGLGNIVSAASETDANGRAEATFELPTGLATPVMGTTVIAATIAGEGGSPITVHTPVYWAIWYYGP